jgi:hypothetical protein
MKYITDAEYDKVISDSIEQEMIDNDKLCKIDTLTIIKHLLCLLEEHEGVYSDFEGNKYRVIIEKDRENEEE